MINPKTEPEPEKETEKCFICYEDEAIPEEENLNFFKPCARHDNNINCNIWAHQECLTDWLKRSQNKKCSTCGQAYIVANGPPNIYENTKYLLIGMIDLIKHSINTLYVLLKFLARNYKNKFQSNILQSQFKFSRFTIHLFRTIILFSGIYQMNFRLSKDEMSFMSIVACAFLGLNLYGYLTFLVGLSDDVLVRYLITDIKEKDFETDNFPDSRELDKIKQLKDMKTLQERNSYQIYRYIVKCQITQWVFSYNRSNNNLINLYFWLETIINYSCSIFIGYIYYHYIQSFWIGKYFWNLNVFGQSYYFIGLFVRSFILPSIISNFDRLKVQVIYHFSSLHQEDLNCKFLKLKFFPNINSKYPYHNFDDEFPELENKNPIPPPNNYYRPCYNCRQKVDLVIIPNSNITPNLYTNPVYCPNEKCEQIPYIPNTPHHQIKYILASMIDLTYNIILLYFYGKVLLLEQVSFLSKCFLIMGILGIVSDTIWEPMKLSRKDIICDLNFLNEHELERDYPEEEENPNNPIKHKYLMKHFMISFSIFGGIFEFYSRQIIYYLSISPKYIWYVFTNCMIHQMCIRYVYPLIYSYLYEQSPKDFMESEIFSYTFSSTVSIPYFIITCIIVPTITYIRKRTTTIFIQNPQIPAKIE